MEWYWVLTIVAGFLGITAGLIYFGSKGILKSGVVGVLANLVASASTAIDALASATDNKALDVIALIIKLVDKAVAAAENAYYNDEIAAEERTERCMAEFDKLLKAANITLTDAQRDVVSTLIAAACEELGHGTVEMKEGQE